MLYLHDRGFATPMQDGFSSIYEVFRGQHLYAASLEVVYTPIRS